MTIRSSIINISYRYTDCFHIFESDDLAGFIVSDKNPEKAKQQLKPALHTFLAFLYRDQCDPLQIVIEEIPNLKQVTSAPMHVSGCTLTSSNFIHNVATAS